MTDHFAIPQHGSTRSVGSISQRQISMANDLAVHHVDPLALISSPECRAWRRISLGTIKHEGLPTRTYLSGQLILTDDERIRIRRKIAELRAACEADDGTENRKARLGLVADLLLAFPIPNGTSEAGRARATAHLVALDDIPLWAIAEAIRRWHRGECGHGYNYHWAPVPAELREVSKELLRPIRETIAHLEAVLSALSLERALDPAPIDPVVRSRGADWDAAGISAVTENRPTLPSTGVFKNL
jgi:hypothetical protein